MGMELEKIIAEQTDKISANISEGIAATQRAAISACKQAVFEPFQVKTQAALSKMRQASAQTRAKQEQQIAAKAAKQREELKQRQADRKQKEETAAKKLEAARKQKEESKTSETTAQALKRMTQEIQNEAHGKILKKQADLERKALAREVENKRKQAAAEARRDEQKQRQAQREARAARATQCTPVTSDRSGDSVESAEATSQKCSGCNLKQGKFKGERCYCYLRKYKWTHADRKESKKTGDHWSVIAKRKLGLE